MAKLVGCLLMFIMVKLVNLELVKLEFIKLELVKLVIKVILNLMHYLMSNLHLFRINQLIIIMK